MTPTTQFSENQKNGDLTFNFFEEFYEKQLKLKADSEQNFFYEETLLMIAMYRA